MKNKEEARALEWGRPEFELAVTSWWSGEVTWVMNISES